MDLSAKMLGSSVVRYLQERTRSAVLTIGADSFDRAALSRVECFNFLAAANLSARLKALGVKSTRDLFDTVPPEALALPRLGAVSLAVLGAAFEAKKIGGERPLESWFAKHHAPDAVIVTFGSLKHRDDAERAAERKTARTRRHSRRNTAHAKRVERFEKRQA